MTRGVWEELRHQLAERGFKIIEGKPIDDAAARLKIDLNDEEQQKRAVIRSLGKEVGADLVAFVAVTDLATDSNGGFLLGEEIVSAKVKCWLLDVNSERYLMSGKVEGVRSDSIVMHLPSQMSSGARACVQAVANAFGRALKAYPIEGKDGKPAK
jgi:hypothetical protein